MNILVTGANGQLGSELRLVSRSSKDTYFFTDVAELDITDAAAVLDTVRKLHIEAVVNCAAYTNVDRAEDDAPLAERLNATAVGNLAAAMREVGGLLVHISTDYVFGGNLNNTPCTEEQATNPTGVYGRTKLLGEEAVAASGCRYLIFRTAWL
ncbi:MAG: NAD(P)-dependent oxidoreductase, partial [Alistipes sp.]|nr:NAD(P)-dependent oxidoreductase [Alistipes sp.]